MAETYTLAEHLTTSDTPLQKGVIQGLLEWVKIAEFVPFVTTGKLNVKVNRWKRLPTAQFRALNETYPTSAGSSEILEESVFVAGGNIDIDRQYQGDSDTIVDPSENQLKMFIASMGYMINDYFINGDPASDPKGFTGLKVRVGNLPARQTVSAAAAADGLDVQASSANRQTFLDKLNETMHMIPGAQVDALFLHQNSYLGLESVLRREGLWRTDKDMFDREYGIYRGARLIDMGTTVTGAFTGATANYILPNTESYTGGGTADGTSVYAVRFGREGGEYLHGWDKHKLQTEGPFKLENRSQVRTNIEWPVGLALFNPFSVARLRDLSWV